MRWPKCTAQSVELGKTPILHLLSQGDFFVMESMILGYDKVLYFYGFKL